jgi:uncharacterized protein
MRSLLVLFVAAALIGGCSSPKTTYYTLSTPAAMTTAAMTQETRIMVGPVTVPPLLDTPQLVVKNSNNQVSVYEYQRWAGSLKTDIERVVSANLVRDLSTPNVWTYTQSPFAHFDYQVLIDVQNIDSIMGSTVSIDVLWMIKRQNHKTPPKDIAENMKTRLTKSSSLSLNEITGRSVVEEPVSGNGFEALVAAQSRAFDKISQQIAKSIGSSQ